MWSKGLGQAVWIMIENNGKLKIIEMKKLLVMFTLALVICGCNKQDDFISSNDADILTAVISDEAVTKTSINVNSVTWDANDKISVFAVTDGTYYNNEYTLVNGAGTQKADFNGLCEGETKVAALYPYNSSNAFSTDGITLTLPDEYNYVEGSNNMAPIAALVSGDNILFKNAGALVSLTVNNIPSGYNKAILRGNGVNGSAKITFDGDIPTLKADNSVTGEVTISFDASSEPTNKTFHFPIPTGTYSNIKIVISDGTNEIVLKNKALTASRNKQYYSTITFDSVSGEIPSEATIENASNVLKESTNVSIDEITDTDTNPTVSLPVETDGKEINIAFESINTTEAITITAADDTQVADKVNITVPTEQDKAKLVIDLPNTTVTITVASGLSTIDELEATTADNTLIVDNGVTINKLIIKKGNVRVKTGATINDWEANLQSGASSVIITENGCTIPTNIPTGCTIMTIAEWELWNAFRNGGSKTITLTEDVEITRPLTLNDSDANITIDLGSYSLTNKTAYDYDNCGKTECYVFEVQAGTLNINGNGSVNAIAGSDYDMAVFANNTGNVNISGGTFTNLGKVNDGSDLIYARDNANITISGGEFKAGNISSDVGNQYVALNLKGGSNASISVTGGKYYKFDPSYNVSENPKMNFVAPGYSSVADGDWYEAKDGIYNETALAKIAAIGGDAVLQADITLSNYIDVRTTLTVKLNGKEIKHPATSGAVYKDVFEVYANGDLTIEGDGKITAEDGYNIYATSGGKVTLNGGTYIGDCSIVYARKNAKVIINAGTYSIDPSMNKEGGQGYNYTLNLDDNNYADIIVKGGRFYKYNPAESAGENPVANFVASGYSSVADGDWYEVKCGIFNELALQAALKANFKSINLDADITITSPILVTNTLEFDLCSFNITAPSTDAFEINGGTLTINGTGKVSAGTIQENTGSVCAVWAHNGGKVTINGGHYTVGPDKNNKRNDCIYAGSNASVTNGTITINGGKFEFVAPDGYTGENGDKFLINGADKTTSKITIAGGEFKNYVPGKESVAPAGKEEIVLLDSNKKVYNNETEVTSAHSAGETKWYIVK